MKTFLLLMASLVLISSLAQAKTKVLRKVQEVSFSEANLNGTARNPDGVYLVQKRGIKFLPLHDLQSDMDTRIRESALYVH
jgi:hypothetical protein